MKHIIRFGNGSTDIEIDADTVAIQPPGLFILVKNGEAVGSFPIHAVAGVWTPDGPAQVKLATPEVSL